MSALYSKVDTHTNRNGWWCLCPPSMTADPMFQNISTDIVRQVLSYLTVADTRALYEACGCHHKEFHKSMRQMSLMNFPNKMWLRLQCNNRVYDYNIYSFNPNQYVPVKIQLRQDKFHCAGVCPCCNKRTSFQFDSIATLHQLSDPGLEPIPYYVAPDIIMVGFYHHLPEEVQQVGHVLDVLDPRYNSWRPAVISNLDKTHLHVRYFLSDYQDVVNKKSPRLALLGTHTDPWNNRGNRYNTKLTKTNWETTGHAVYLQHTGETAPSLKLLEE